MKYSRVLLKLSGEALGSLSEAVDHEAVMKAARQIAKLIENGVEVGVVLGGGNIWRGRSSNEMDRNRADHMGMLATAINSLALQDALEQIEIPSKVLSAVEMQRFADSYSAREANRLLREKNVVIFACGTGSPFFSTDTAAALRAMEIRADALLLAKNIDAVYSADPKRDSAAIRYSHLSYDQMIRDDLKATDLTAITLCKENDLPIRVFAMKEEGSILSVVSGGAEGTLIDKNA